MQHFKNVIVTGSNKGIGFAIAENLASKEGWNVIMAVRNLELGEISKAAILAKHPNAHIQLEKVDISSTASIDSFVPLIKQKYKAIDVLVNNAGVLVKGDEFDSKVVTYTFATNFYGTIHLTEQLLPLLAQNGKVVSLASSLGRYNFNKITNESLKSRFRNEKISRAQLFQLVHEFEKDVEANVSVEKGWPRSAYGISKLCLKIYHKILCSFKEVKEKQIQVYSCCPGYVNTDMTDHKGPLTLEQGSRTPLYLVELPSQVDPAFQGAFFFQCKLTDIFAPNQ